MAKTTKKTESQVEGGVTVTLTPEQHAALLAMLAGSSPKPLTDTKADAQNELAQAFITAINSTKPPEKKNSFNRIKKGAFDPKDGSKKPALRRIMFQHGVQLTEDTLTKDEIELLNKVKPGSYCGGFIRVIRRRDRGIDIDYPVNTASQRLKLVNQFGITNLCSLLNRLLEEAADPAKYKAPDEDEDY
jgi:hypothetical protein